MDFPDLVQALLDAGRRVHTHAHEGYWLDLGRPDDFSRANEEFQTLRPRLGI
jgi:NDP-sugar pyrophosphorylase family protein